jgi:peptide-methionine (R)-S-oxide reductase
MHDWTEVITRAARGNVAPDRRVERTPEDWRARLEPDVYRITREAATERAFSSGLCGLFEPGRYACACCGTELFDGGAKYESHSGWPSFTQPVKDNVVDYVADDSHGMRRIEARCSTCDAHLGHVFPDGPAPTGLRYCINALALRKVGAHGAG